MSTQIYEEVRCDYRYGNYYYIDAWWPGDDQGHTIAAVHSSGDVFRIPCYAMDDQAEKVISEVVAKIREEQC